MKIQNISHNTAFRAHVNIKDPDSLLDLTQKIALEAIIKGKGKSTDWVQINISPIKKSEPESYTVNIAAWIKEEVRCYSMEQTNSSTIHGSIREIPEKLPFRAVLELTNKAFDAIPKRFREFVN